MKYLFILLFLVALSCSKDSSPDLQCTFSSTCDGQRVVINGTITSRYNGDVTALFSISGNLVAIHRRCIIGENTIGYTGNGVNCPVQVNLYSLQYTD